METNKIIKPKEYDQFTVIPSYIFRQKNISSGATGLYCWLFSHNSEFKISTEFIVSHFKDGRDSINNRIKELISFGYLIRQEVRVKGKFAGYNYILNDKPKTDKPKTGKPQTEKPYTDNPQQSNINNNISYNIKSNINKSNSVKYDFSKNSIESYPHILSLFPKRFQPKNRKQKIDWLSVIDKLERIDGYDPRQVYYIVKKARDDDFWKDNFYSISKLRKKNKEGILYIDYFAERYGKNIF